MFYEVLMEKSAAKKERKSERESVLAPAATAGGLYMGHRGVKHLDKKFNKKMIGIVRERAKNDPAKLEKLLQEMGGVEQTKQLGGAAKTYALETNDGRMLNVNLGGWSPDGNYNPQDRMLGRSRGQINMGDMQDESVFLHELGHATGSGSRSRNARFRAGLQMAAPVARGVGALTGLGAGALAYTARNKEEADRANRVANMGILAQGLAAAPTLAEEARATIRARGLAKKFGRTLDKKSLGAAYGTYAGAALASMAPSLGAKLYTKYRQHQLKEAGRRETEEETIQRLAPIGLGVGAGAMAGAGLAGRSKWGKDVARQVLETIEGLPQSDHAGAIEAVPGLVQKIVTNKLVGLGGGALVGAGLGYGAHRLLNRRQDNRE